MVITKKKTLPFATTWTDLKGVMLSAIRETERDKSSMILPNVCNLIRPTHRNRQMGGCQESGVGKS